MGTIFDFSAVSNGDVCLTGLTDRFLPSAVTQSFFFLLTPTCQRMADDEFIQVFMENDPRSQITCKNLLMSGPSGFGKSYILQYLGKKAPYQ